MPRKHHRQRPKFRVAVILALVVIFSAVFISSRFQPSNIRDWVKDFEETPQVSLIDHQVTFHNLRDWQHTETETISHDYVSRTYDVNNLEKTWFIIEPFGGWDGIAHTYFVFDFKDQEPVSLSIEARREEGEDYQAFSGLFNKYELIYLWGTETDFTVKRVVQLKNNVHMYPLEVSQDFQKNLFLELVHATEKLEQEPRFYNTITSNCTNNLADHANFVKPGSAPFHYARILTGFSGKYVYNLGYIPHDIPYTEVRDNYRINDIVEQIYQEEDFSSLLRQELSQR